MFNVTIESCSKELSAKERVLIKDTTAATKLDAVVKGDESVEIYVDFYAVLNVHNDKADPVDYKNYVIVDKNGEVYVTGSNSFWNAFNQISEEMAGSEDDWGIKVYKRDSKNYSGKQFITCKII